MESVTDGYCIEKILAGRTEYFSVLMKKYSQPVFSLIVKMAGNREDAEELTQDVFLKVFRSLSTFRGNSSFSTWLYRIAYNTAISAMRKPKPEWLPFEEIADTADEDAEDEVAGLDSNIQLDRLQKALQQLPPDDRALLMLFYTHEKTVDEISIITRLSRPNVKTKLHRIRKKLLLLMTEDI
ncbi:MAG: sigma-70 family RNA polymerase sigma factor [Tannerella sp.]|jgi:RNA polymerase sigma-70 factor (ECF subfamily)|nr:sigma-70 family RNA polymerase sigma factor [Tannerella sp.]